jgi:predicted regulator of Ras-like GTPase activity (Roadblock/LC7/MglB family)
MAFRTHLEEIVKQVEGAVACSVMGFDGIAIDTHLVSDPGVDVNTVLIEYSNVLAKLKEATASLEAGSMSEVAIATVKLTTIARLLTPEYYLVLALSPEGNMGKGRYALRIAAPKLKAELE